jgi:glyoxylase-like metal-dependent hydrolase (beta-lactamase superfamily II)
MKIALHCYALTGLAYIPPWMVNAGLVVGEETTLVVDTGATMQSARTIYGYAQAVRPQNRLLAMNTERHLDHLCGNSLFRDLGIDVYGHRDIARTEQEIAGEIEELNACIPNSVRRQHEEARICYAGTHISNPNKRIDQEMRLDLGNFPVQILLTPGHTTTNISLFVPADDVLYCGDCLVNTYLPNLEAGNPSLWQTWLRSLERIEELAPEIVVPGHGEVMRAAGIRREVERTRQILTTAIHTGIAPTLA